ncbi:hypothetical protein CR513_34150, partial [Mucuna pruriens]
MEAEERHRLAEERHMEALRAAKEHEEELRQQLATMKTTIEKLGGVVAPPVEGNQVFWAQLFDEGIDGTPIPSNFREPAIEPNPVGCGHVLVGHPPPPPPHSIRSFKDLATSFASKFAANKTKRLEVTDLFDIRQAKGKTFKSYLAWFNNATVRAFQKGLRAGQFSNSLVLRRPLSMVEIRTRAKKHIDVEEDQADRLDAERQLGTRDTQPTQ